MLEFVEAPSPNFDARRGPPDLILPAVVTAFASLAVGLFAGFALSPLGWATLIVEEHYTP